MNKYVGLRTGLVKMCDNKSIKYGKNLKEHGVSDALYSALNHTVGQTVIKIWVKFKLPHRLTPKSPLSCNSGLDYHHTSKLGSTAKE